MRNEFLPFSRPDVSEDEIGAVAEVLRSGWLTTGPKCAEFERAFADYCGARGATAVASATAGLHCALRALGVGPGDEVVTPSMTWVSVPNLVCLLGAKPVFADVDRDTLMVSRKTVEPLITGRTKAIVPVHFAGAPLDLAPLRELSLQTGIPLIEDAAHAAGTECEGERIGKTGTCVFSFHPIKNLTAGEGGMVCSDDPELLERIGALKFHGLGVDAFDRQTQGRAPQAEVLVPGFKYNLTDVAAALGLGQLSRLDAFIARRAELDALYRKRLADVPELLPLSDPPRAHRHARHLFVVRLDLDRAGANRDEFMEKLKARNVGTGIHFRAVHLQRHYRETFGFRPGSLPNTEWNAERILSLPLFPAMTDDDVADVVEAVKEALQ